METQRKQSIDCCLNISDNSNNYSNDNDDNNNNNKDNNNDSSIEASVLELVAEAFLKASRPDEAIVDDC